MVEVLNYKRENTLDSSTDGVDYWRALSSTGRSVKTKALSRSFSDFGCVLDGITDDSAAAQDALDWFCGGGGNRRLVLPPNCLMYITTPLVADFQGRRDYSLEMYSNIKPEPGMGDCLTLINTKQSFFYLRVAEGGQDADYTQADPVGADQAFVIRGCRSCEIIVNARYYQGRVLRVNKEIGSENKTSFNVFDITVESGASKCGQSLYAQGTTAFGEIRQMNDTASHYAPVFDDVTDLTITRFEGGQWEESHMLFDACGSVWIGDLLLGADSAAAYNVEFNACKRVNVMNTLVGGCVDLILVKDVPITGPGVVFHRIEATFFTGTALVLDNVWRVKAYISSTAGATACHIINSASRFVDLDLDVHACTAQAVIKDSGVRDVKITGVINGAGDASHAALSLLGNDLGVEVTNLTVEASSANYILECGASNSIVWTGGRVFGGTTGKFSNAPRAVRNVLGYKNEAEGFATIPNGATSVTVTHGLASTPDWFVADGRSSVEVSAPWTSGPTSTQFTIGVASAVTADRTVYWRAKFGSLTP